MDKEKIPAEIQHFFNVTLLGKPFSIMNEKREIETGYLYEGKFYKSKDLKPTHSIDEMISELESLDLEDNIRIKKKSYTCS